MEHFMMTSYLLLKTFSVNEIQALQHQWGNSVAKK